MGGVRLVLTARNHTVEALRLAATEHHAPLRGHVHLTHSGYPLVVVLGLALTRVGLCPGC